MKKYIFLFILGVISFSSYAQIKVPQPVIINSVKTGFKMNIDSIYKQVQVLGITNKVKVDSSYTRYKNYVTNFVAPDTTKTRYKVYVNNFVAPDTTKTRRAVVIDSLYKSVQIHGITDPIVVDSTKTRFQTYVTNFVAPDTTKTRYKVYVTNFVAPDTTKTRRAVVIDSVYKSVQIHGIIDPIVVDSTKTRGYVKINNIVDIDSTTTRRAIVVDSVYKSIQIHGITDKVIIDSTSTRGHIIVDSLTYLVRVKEQYSLDGKYLVIYLGDSLDVSPTTSYYPDTLGFSADAYKGFALQLITLGGITTTIEATLDPTLPSSTWIDITKGGYDLATGVNGSASYIDKSGIVDFVSVNVKRIRIKCVASDSSNSIKYYVRLRAL